MKHSTIRTHNICSSDPVSQTEGALAFTFDQEMFRKAKFRNGKLGAWRMGCFCLSLTALVSCIDEEIGVTDDSGGGGGAASTLLDCAETSNSGSPKCAAGGIGTLGKGPLFHDGVSSSSAFGGGFVDTGTNELVMAVGGFLDKASGEFVGGILAIDLATGNRRVVSGYYYDPDSLSLKQKGTGNGTFFGNISDVVRKSDGKYLAFSIDKQSGSGDRRRTLEIDPATGNWSVYINFDIVPCDKTLGGTTGDFQGGLAIDNKDRLYAFYDTNGNPNDSSGVLRFTPENPDCMEGAANSTVFSGLGTGPLVGGAGQGGAGDIGGGADIAGLLGGLTFHNGFLYATDSSGGKFISINVETGARAIVSKHSSPGKGAGDVPVGGGWVDIDQENNIAWVSGECKSQCAGDSSFPVMTINLVTGDRTGYPKVAFDGPTLQADRTNPIFKIPGSKLAVFADSKRKALVFVDLEAKLTNFFSY